MIVLNWREFITMVIESITTIELSQSTRSEERTKEDIELHRKDVVKPELEVE